VRAKKKAPAKTKPAAKTQAPRKTPKPEPDWERIKTQYRVNTQSVREIAAEHGITEGAIRKHALKHKWERDLAAQVQSRADALVRKDTVRSEVRTLAKVDETQVVEIEAQVQARIRLQHRQDIHRARGVALKLLGELEHQTDHQDLYEQLGELLLDPVGEQSSKAAEERAQKLREAFYKAMSLGSRTKTMVDLANTLRVLIDKEREAHGINVDKGAGADGLALVTLRDMTGHRPITQPPA
jgi:hypothetical protein